MYVKIKLLEGGKLPAYKRKGDACLDCYSAETTTIANGTRKLIRLGFAVEIPAGYEGLVRPRSGHTSNGIDIGLGTVDETYRGEVKACVINDSGKGLEIEAGDRICQLAIRKSEDIQFEVVKELSDTERGAEGFGSSGIK